MWLFFFQAEDGIRDAQESRGLGDVYKRQVIHTLVGSEKMDDEVLAENISEVIKFFEKKLEKGFDNIKSIYIKTTMGPAIKLEDFR